MDKHFPQHIYWKDYAFFIVYPKLLCQKSIDHCLSLFPDSIPVSLDNMFYAALGNNYFIIYFVIGNAISLCLVQDCLWRTDMPVIPELKR